MKLNLIARIFYHSINIGFIREFIRVIDLTATKKYYPEKLKPVLKGGATFQQVYEILYYTRLFKYVPFPELHYTEQLLTYACTKELAEQYEVGLVKKHSIMAGHITFRVYKPDGEIVGHVGYKDGNWKYPKDFKRPIWNLNRLPDAEFLFLVTNPFDALKILSFGFPHVSSLLGDSMTDDQLQQLIDHEYLQGITLIHSDPMNIVSRVAKHLYIRYFIPPKPIRDFDLTEFQQLINPQ